MAKKYLTGTNQLLYVFWETVSIIQNNHILQIIYNLLWEKSELMAVVVNDAIMFGHLDKRLTAHPSSARSARALIGMYRGNRNSEMGYLTEKFRNRVFRQSITERWPFPDESIDLIVTSPPYWMHRDNGVNTFTWWGGKADCRHSIGTKSRCLMCDAEWAQLGNEKDPRSYVEHLVSALNNEAERCLRPDGQMWINVGDTYSRGIRGLPWGEEKQRLLIPYRVAMGLQERGWVLRSELIWAKSVAFQDGSTKGGGMPSAIHNRLNQCHEPFFGFVKRKSKRRPFYIRERDGKMSYTRLPDSKKIEYFSDMNPIRLKHVWVDSDGKRTDFYGRRMGSAPNAGASVKQHSLGQPNLYMENHPLGKNPGSVWQINLDGFTGQKLTHTAPYPKALVERIIMFGSPQLRCSICELPIFQTYSASLKKLVSTSCICDSAKIPALVFDPFMGSGTTAIAALQLDRDYGGLELKDEFHKEFEERIKLHEGLQVQMNLFGVRSARKK